MTTWAMEEFSGAKLGDGRLNLRLIMLATRFADKPTASIPGACPDWAETLAAYRFFDQANKDKRSLGWQDILAPHIAQTEARMRQHPVVLCLQDTTELDFNGRCINGLGPLSYEAQRGMYLHPTYAVTPEREPLGVTDAWMWAREPKATDGTRPGIRESLRWTEGYERIAEMAATLPTTRLVYIADREADIVELMQRAHALGTPADWLIRSQHNRCLPDGGKLWAAVLAGSPLGEVEFMMPSRHGQAARPVRQQLFARQASLADGEGGRLSVTCLIAGSKPCNSVLPARSNWPLPSIWSCRGDWLAWSASGERIRTSPRRCSSLPTSGKAHTSSPRNPSRKHRPPSARSSDESPCSVVSSLEKAMANPASRRSGLAFSASGILSKGSSICDQSMLYELCVMEWI